MAMIMEKSSYEAAGQDHTTATGTCLEEKAPGGIPLEASEFESLLERAMEILSVREHSAT